MRDFAASHGLDVGKTVAECRDTFPRDGAIDTASMQRTIDWHVRKGYATAPVNAAQLIDASFLEEARKLLATGGWRRAPSTPRERS